MYDMYNCGCFERPGHDDRKDKACDFNSTFLGNGLVRQRETIRITANQNFRNVFLSDGNGSTNVKVKIKNLSPTNPIVVQSLINGQTLDTTVEPNGEFLISSFFLSRLQIRTANAGTIANVLLCFELLVCNAACSGFGPLLTNDVNPDSQEENI